MSDAFFTNPRPFTKRKREDGPNAGASRSGSGGGGGRARGGAGFERDSGYAANRGASSVGRGFSAGRGGASSRGARGSNGARGRGGASSRGGAMDRKGKQRAEKDDEELDRDGQGMNGGFDSDSDDADPLEGQPDDDESESEDESETPAQKRLRLSQMYLQTLEKDVGLYDGGFDAADLDRDLIADRLQKDVLSHTGKLHLNIANFLQFPIPSSRIFHSPSKGHRGAVTSAVASEDGSWLYTASKDGSIIKWDMRSILSPSTYTSTSAAPTARITQSVYFPKKLSESSKRKPVVLSKKEKAAEKALGKAKSKAEGVGGHTDEVLDLALSHDGNVLASGGKDKVVGVWNVEGEGGKWTRGLGGHKDRVASISFRMGTHQLYSSSFDRTIKLFDLSTLSYIETLFGHQDSIQTVTSLRAEVAVSAGGRDKTIRFWKVTEESQLVFRGGVASRIRNVLDGGMEEDGIEDEAAGGKRRRKERGEVKYVEGSVDCVTMVDDTTFLSGGDSGSICLWTITKKKPISTVQLAHGVQEVHSETEGTMSNARWITALACLGYGDVFASGSWDGMIRLWKIDERVRSFSMLTTIPAPGYVNSLQLICPSMRSNEGLEERTARNGDAEASKRREKSLVVVAATSKEPRLGRWMRTKEGKEGALVAVILLGADTALEKEQDSAVVGMDV